MPEPNKVKGCDIYKEFEGVKALGTITKYIPSANLFEVWVSSFIYNWSIVTHELIIIHFPLS